MIQPDLIPMDPVPINPLMIYFGGKWKLAQWIASIMPDHRIYVEPFGGAGSVLLRKPRSKLEVYNDISDRVSNVFRMMRDRGDELCSKLRMTPYSRRELVMACERSDDPIEDARRTIVRAHMSRGRAMRKHKGLRYSKKSNRTPEKSWASWVERSDVYMQRLMGVLIENRDAIKLIQDFDTPMTLFYMDPPYLSNARLEKRRPIYQHEMMDEESHQKLLHLCLSLKGSVMISGYDCELYNTMLSSWERRERHQFTTAHTKATEVLWVKRSDACENGSKRNIME